MNPSSLSKDIWLCRAKGSAVQRQKDMNRNRLDDELGETNNLSGSALFFDEARRTSFKNNYGVRQQPERSGAHETDEGGRITFERIFENYS
jgi:hypothetical protein